MMSCMHLLILPQIAAQYHICLVVLLLAYQMHQQVSKQATSSCAMCQAGLYDLPCQADSHRLLINVVRLLDQGVACSSKP